MSFNPEETSIAARSVAIQAYAGWERISRPTQTGWDIHYVPPIHFGNQTITPRRYIPAATGRYKQGLGTQFKVPTKTQRTQTPVQGIPPLEEVKKGRIMYPRDNNNRVDGLEPHGSNMIQPSSLDEEATGSQTVVRQGTSSESAETQTDDPTDAPSATTSTHVSESSEQPSGSGLSTIPASEEEQGEPGWLWVTAMEVADNEEVDLDDWEICDLLTNNEELSSAPTFKVPEPPVNKRPRTPGSSLEHLFAAREVSRTAVAEASSSAESPQAALPVAQVAVNGVRDEEIHRTALAPPDSPALLDATNPDIHETSAAENVDASPGVGQPTPPDTPVQPISARRTGEFPEGQSGFGPYGEQPVLNQIGDERDSFASALRIVEELIDVCQE